jgi:hypothetical protein
VACVTTSCQENIFDADLNPSLDLDADLNPSLDLDADLNPCLDLDADPSLDFDFNTATADSYFGNRTRRQC